MKLIHHSRLDQQSRQKSAFRHSFRGPFHRGSGCEEVGCEGFGYRVVALWPVTKWLRPPYTRHEAWQVFKDTKVVVMGTRQPKSLRSFLVRSCYSSTPTISTQRERVKEVDLKHCSVVCKYHRLGYVTPCSSFTFGNNQRWEYTRSFDCNSRNVLYIPQCNNCSQFYIGETEDLKQN